MALNLEKQLRFYGAYHHDPVNIAIHMTCVPLILITSFLFLTNASLPSFFTLPYLPSNFGIFFCTLYSLGYIALDPVAGGVLAPILLGCTVYATHLTSTYGSTANKWSLGVHVFSWLAQFVGHGVYEGRAPALLDNLVQAIFLAPFFVWLEGLFALGYRPELRGRLEKQVEEDIAVYRAGKLKGKGAAQTNGKAHG